MKEEDLLVNTFKFKQKFFYIYYSTKGIADSHNLQGKLEALTLNVFLGNNQVLVNEILLCPKFHSYGLRIG